MCFKAKLAVSCWLPVVRKRKRDEGPGTRGGGGGFGISSIEVASLTERELFLSSLFYRYVVPNGTFHLRSIPARELILVAMMWW